MQQCKVKWNDKENTSIHQVPLFLRLCYTDAYETVLHVNIEYWRTHFLALFALTAYIT